MANLIEPFEGTVLITDNELLGRYLYKNDSLAFEELVRRHSGLVMGVCRKMLLHAQDAEDAFQATFWILSRKSKTLIDHGSIAGWLYQTALRNCLQIRRRKSRAREIEMIEEPTGTDEPWQTISKAQEFELIYREINRLPKRYRDVIVLCHLQGQSRHEAADFLALTEASVKAALARGRQLLRRRLIRSGLMTSVALGVLATTTAQAQDSIPEPLIKLTLSHCQGQSPVIAGTETQLIHSFSNFGVFNMQTATIIKSISLAASFALVAAIPLVLLAQNSAVGGSDDPVVVSLDLETSEDDSAVPQITIENLTRSAQQPTNDKVGDQVSHAAKAHDGTSINLPLDETASNPLMYATNTNRATAEGNLDPFAKEDSLKYWELMLKSHTTRTQAISASVQAHGKSKAEQLQLMAEKYELEAKAIEAQLNLDRIKMNAKTKSENHRPVDLTLPGQSVGIVDGTAADPLSGRVTNVNSARQLIAVSLGSNHGLQTGIELDVFRAQRYVGRATVVHVQPDISTAKIAMIVGVENVRVGDGVQVHDLRNDRQARRIETLQQQIEDTAKLLSSTEPRADSQSRPTIDQGTNQGIPPASTAVVKPGEALLVESASNETFNRRVVVRSDHTISLPLVGTISVKGTTTKQIAAILEDKFSKFAKNPHMFVVRESASTPSRSNGR